ncbi:MAG: 50S ribosomal protein L6 [Patescibacteria group bacterium]
MSRLGKKPIEIPEGVEVKVDDGKLNFKGKQGELSLKALPFLDVKLENSQLSFSPNKKDQQAAANWGTMVALAKNAIVGVSDGFSKTLQIEGVGYRATMEGADLILNVGFSHPVKFKPFEGVQVEVEKNSIKVSGIDRALVGEVAAKIRKIKKPEPYKGKGIRYSDEVVRRKAGKKAVGAGG